MKAEVASPKLCDIAVLNPPLASRLPSNETVSFVPMAAVDAETARIETTIDRLYEDVSKGYTPFLSGDVLVAKITPCFENGKIAQAMLPRHHGFGSTEFHVVRPMSGISDGRYLHHFLRLDRVRSEGQRRMTGSAGQRRVPASYLAELAVPLPPLPEQRRIAAILDQAETLRAQRRAALAQLDDLARSIFLDMFGEHTGCKSEPLSAVCELITDGTHYTPTYVESGVTFLSAKNVTSGCIDWDKIKFIPKDLHRELHKRVAPRIGDVLLAKNGTTGVAAIVDRDCVFDIYVSLALLRPRKHVLAVFLHAALNSPLAKKQFNASLKGIGVPNLHLKDIRGASIPVPEIEIQRTFAARIQAIESLKTTHRAALAELDALFASLQHRAFSGELTRFTLVAVPAPSRKRSFAELGHLDTRKGVEVLAYAARRLPGKSHYWPLKVTYFADRHHLEHHGRTIYGETQMRMPHGPVPQAAYNASRALEKGELICEFPMDVVRAALRRDGDQLIALRDADFSLLSAQERASLDWAIRYVADMGFDQLKTASHDAAWEKTPANRPMAWSDIIRTLPEAAQQRLFAEFE